MASVRLTRRRLIAVVRWAPAWLLITVASFLLSTLRVLALVGVARRQPGLMDLGITGETLAWPVLIALLALVRRAPTWRSGEALATIYLLVGPLALVGTAIWLRLPFPAAMEMLGLNLLVLTMFVVLIWPAGAAAIWFARRFNRRRNRAAATARPAA